MLNDVAPIRGAVRLPARAFGVLVVLLGALSCGADEPATPVAVCDRAACDGCCDAHGGCRPAGSAACKGGSGSGGSNGSSAGGAGGPGGAGGAGTPGGAAGSPDSTAAGGGASGPVAGGAGASGASGGAGSSGASGGVGAAGAPSTECPNGTLVPVDIQPSINPPDTVAVLLSSTPEPARRAESPTTARCTFVRAIGGDFGSWSPPAIRPWGRRCQPPSPSVPRTRRRA